LTVPYAKDCRLIIIEADFTEDGMATITQENKWTVQRLTVTALLIAIGIVIPMVMPGIYIEPASFTIASHVAIFIAMMIDPAVGAIVAVGTVMGFFMRGLPIVIPLRAASHIVFVLIGAFYLKRHPETLRSVWKSQVFSFIIAIIHSVCEIAVVFWFYFSGQMANFASVQMVVLFLGLGSVVHSMVDFGIAYLIYKALIKVPSLRNLFIK
jgi:niacin transporter